MPGSEVLSRTDVWAYKEGCPCSTCEAHRNRSPKAEVPREFCEMWGEIGLAHEAAVECREYKPRVK